ncbi:MAG: tRNA pseudouridine(55) synthase, partial [Patescibacteria group bacterium]|nr:tRNA pseudouridine(55) synthase [Patescibacteria group bacterium]
MNIEGIFAVDKPLGISSQRAVQIVKYWARRKTGNKKIKVGHAGTLDPLASGVLVV